MSLDNIDLENIDLKDLKIILLMMGIQFYNDPRNTTIAKRTIIIEEDKFDNESESIFFKLLNENNFQYRRIIMNSKYVFMVNKRIII